MADYTDYSDDFRDAAVALLFASGYPQKKILTYFAGTIGVSPETLSRWVGIYTERQQIATTSRIAERETQIDVISKLIEDNLLAVLAVIPSKLDKANLKDLAVTVGILTDKLALLSGRQFRPGKADVVVNIRNTVAPWAEAGDNAVDITPDDGE